MKRILSIITGLVITASFMATMFSVTRSTAAGGGKDKTQPPMVSSKQLVAEFLKDSKAAGKTYGNTDNPKELIVVGLVVKIVDARFGVGKVANLEGVGGVMVACLLSRKDEAIAKVGAEITIRGKCRVCLSHLRW